MRASLVAICCASGFLAVPIDSLAQYDDGARFAFTASAEKSTIYVLDLQEQRLSGDISLDDVPDSVSASQTLKALVIAHRGSNKLTLIDLSNDALPRIEYPLDISPDYIDVSPLGETVAIYDHEQNVLEIHAVKRGAILLHANDIETDQAFTFSFDGSAIYWVDRNSGTLNVVDLWSSRQQFQLSRPGNRLSALTRSTDGLLGFVSNADTDEVYVINLSDFSLLTTLRAGREPGRSWGTADGRYMFVPNREDKTVSAITTSNLQLQYTVKVGVEPVAIHPGWLDTTAAIVGADGSIAVIDIASGEISQRFEFGNPLLEGIVTSDSKTLALPLPALGEFVFIDMRHQEKLDSVGGMPTDIGIASIAVSNNLCH